MKKFLALGMSAAMVLGLAACGSTPTESTPSSSSQPSSSAESQAESSPEESTAASEAEPKALSGEVVYWSMWQETEPQADILKESVAAFEKANPDVKVTVEWQGRGVKDLVSAAVAAGETVDLFDSDPMVFYKADPSVMLDLSDFYSSMSLDGSTTVADSILKGLVDWDKSLSEEYAGGGYHAVPYNPYAITWFYNKDHFAKAGIEKLPETWEELDAACSKLKAAGYEPIITDDAYFPMMFNYYLARGIGEPAIKEMLDTANYDNAMLLQALKAMEDFSKKGYFAASCKTNKYPAGQQSFARQEASMYFNASFMAAENAETAGENFPYGHFAYPAVPGGTGTITENSVGGQAFVVNAKTENKEAVYELLRYFVGQDTQQNFLNNGLTPNFATVDWPAALSEQKPIVNSLTGNINWGASVGGEFADSVITPAVKSVMLGEKSADAAYKEIQDAAAKLK